MAFNSFHFLAYFPVVFFLFYALPHRFRWTMLFFASCYFYMAWRPAYIVLLLGAIGVCYIGGLRVERAESQAEKRRVVTLCLVSLLGVLFVFKYFNFAAETAVDVAGLVGVGMDPITLSLVLPIGISFYTFQLLSYVIDVYKGEIPAEPHLGRFALYGSFFPQLVAGPIERAGNLMPQLSREVSFDYDRAVSGLQLMLWGFFKKTVVADRLAPFVNAGFADPEAYGGHALAVATVFFAFQVYCDFSAYSDIAIGAARSMGVDLMDNFQQPYFARSISEFWKRWHISLTTWLTDYVYAPLTKARAIKLPWYQKFMLALFLTFVISGLWHGAAWTFVAWGALHGAYLVGSLMTEKVRRRVVKRVGLNRVPLIHDTLRVAITFVLVLISYVFFRADTLGDALFILGRIPTDLLVIATGGGSEYGLTQPVWMGGGLSEFVVASWGISVTLIVDGLMRFRPGLISRLATHTPLRWGAYLALVFSIAVLGAFYQEAQAFIYFQF